MKSRTDVQQLMEAVFRECSETRAAGQKEYAHREENALDNFDSEAKDLQLDRKKVGL